MSRQSVVVSVALALFSVACTSSGEIGDNGLVRFSFVGDYANPVDASTPVAVHTTLRVQLQHPSAVVDQGTYVQLHLTGKAISGSTDPEVFPTGIAEYGVYFSEAGTYELIAMNGNTAVDQIELTAKDPTALVFDSDAIVITNGDKCGDSSTVSLGDVDLAENQMAQLTLVPEVDGTPMMGLPALVAGGEDATFDSVASSYALTPLTLDVTPTSFGQDVTVTATDLGNNLTAKATLKTHTGQAAVSCN